MRNAKTLTEYARAGIDAKDWYVDAAREIRQLSRQTKWPAARIAEVTAVFSPRCAVRRNVRLALHYLVTGRILPGCIRSVRRSIVTYESTGLINGPKTEPFARALLGDPTAVVLDSWMARALQVDPRSIRNLAVIAAASRRIYSVSHSLDISPASAQACIWMHVRSLAGFSPVPFPLMQEFTNGS